MSNDVTIIIITYNGEKYIHNCLESLKSQTFSKFNVSIFDNGSLDGTENVVNHFGYKLTKSKRNLGFTGGNNEAIKQVNTKYVVLLNQDTICAPNWPDFLAIGTVKSA